MNTARKTKPKNRDRKGAVTVEFALVLPLILITFFGMVLLTRLVVLRDVAQHAAYEGARRGMVFNSTADECKQHSQDFLAAFGVQNAVITTDPPALSIGTKVVTVNVDIPFSENAWGGAVFLPSNWEISRTLTLTRDFAL